jgi:hypothetical protein
MRVWSPFPYYFFLLPNYDERVVPRSHFNRGYALGLVLHVNN